MPKRKINFFLISILIVSGLAFSNYFSSAKQSGDDGQGDKARGKNIEREYGDNEIPEADGDYKVRGDSTARVRVIIHKERGKTPAPSSLVCSDPDASAPVDWAGWKIPACWTYKTNPARAPASVGRTNFVAIALSSFTAWASQSGISFTRLADTTATKKSRDNQNIVVWGTTSGTALGVTYIWYNSLTKTAVELDTILNKQKPWSWTTYAAGLCANPTTYDAQNILTHEIGHWLGLDDEYDSLHLNSTMYGYGSKGEIKKDTLTTGDIAGIKAIY